MSEYHLVEADKAGAAIEVYDNWPAARRAWLAIRDRRAVRLLCMWGCGCMRQAVRRGKTGNGWRRTEACAFHALLSKRVRNTLQS